MTRSGAGETKMFPENLAISFSVFTLLFIHLRYLSVHCWLLAMKFLPFAFALTILVISEFFFSCLLQVHCFDVEKLNRMYEGRYRHFIATIEFFFGGG